jgi:hypothetical protein
MPPNSTLQAKTDDRKVSTQDWRRNEKLLERRIEDRKGTEVALLFFRTNNDVSKHKANERNTRPPIAVGLNCKRQGCCASWALQYSNSVSCSSPSPAVAAIDNLDHTTLTLVNFTSPTCTDTHTTGGRNTHVSPSIICTTLTARRRKLQKSCKKQRSRMRLAHGIYFAENSRHTELWKQHFRASCARDRHGTSLPRRVFGWS